MERALCPVVIGREREVSALEDALLSANRGAGRVLLLAGDAGMGKTRLANELASRARSLGMEVLLGSCSEAELALPYLPFLEAVGNYLAGIDVEEVRARLGPVRRELAHLFPQLEPESAAPDVESMQGKLRLFEALLALLRLPADRQGLLILVEDVHWADASTRELLDYLTRRLRSLRILVVATYRRDEMHRRHPLLPMIQGWKRAGTSVVELDPLQPQQVADVVRAIFDIKDVREDTRDFLHRRSEGNPFVLEELLKAALDQGDIYRTETGWDRRALAEIRLPESVKDTILLRLDRLTEEEVDVLRCAAVLGGPFSYEALVAVSGRAEATIQDAVEVCLQQQLFEEHPGGDYRFRHALTREAVYEDTILPHRRRLHSRAADVLAAAGAPAVEISRHLLAGGRAAEAVPLCLEAATAAELSYAHNDAAALYERVIPHLTNSPLEATVLCRMGTALLLAGDSSTARGHLEAGIETMEGLGDTVMAAHYRLRLGRTLWELFRADLALENYERAREALEPAGPSEDLALAYMRLAGLRLFQLDGEGCAALARRGVEVAEAAGSEVARVWCTGYLGAGLSYSGKIAEGVAMVDRSFDEATAGGHAEIADTLLYNGCVLRIFGGRVGEVQARVGLFDRHTLIGTSRVSRHSLEAWALGLTGWPARALIAARRAVEQAEDLGSPTWKRRAAVVLTLELTEAGLLDEAKAVFDQYAEPDELQDKLAHALMATRLLPVIGETERLRSVAQTIRGIVKDWPDGLAYVVADRVAGHEIATGDLEAGKQMSHQLAPSSRVLAESARRRLDGRIALAEGHAEVALAAFEEGRRGFGGVDYWVWAAETILLEAGALAALGRDEVAVAALHELQADAAMRGARLIASEAAAMLADLGADPGPATSMPLSESKVAAVEPVGERLVTVLFADVRGYTALSRTSVPAELAERIGTYQRWAAEEVARHRGVVDKFAGDAVMATFNVSGATIDHAVHALETAVALRDKADALGLPVGIGIATGPAVVGTLAPGANLSVLGEATNLAARLQGAAGPGEILLDAEAGRRTSVWLTAHRLEAPATDLNVKGFDVPVRAHRLRGTTNG